MTGLSRSKERVEHGAGPFPKVVFNVVITCISGEVKKPKKNQFHKAWYLSALFYRSGDNKYIAYRRIECVHCRCRS